MDGSSPDNDGRPQHRQMRSVRQANEEGVTRVNPWSKASQEQTTSSNLTDAGWVAVRAGDRSWSWQLADGFMSIVGEVIVKGCGVAMMKLQGHSGTPPLVSGRK